MAFKKSIAKRAAIVALALAAGGCYTVTYRTGLPGNGVKHEEGAHFFLWGLVNDKTLNLDAVCPTGVSRWYNQATFLDGFLTFITIGIYDPRTIVVECASGAAFQMTPHPDENLTEVRLVASR